MIARIAYEYPLDDTTLFEDVHQVRPGTVETWSLTESGAKLESVESYHSDVVRPDSEWSIDSAPALLESLTSSIADSFQDLPYQSGIIEFRANQHAPLRHRGRRLRLRRRRVRRRR